MHETYREKVQNSEKTTLTYAQLALIPALIGLLDVRVKVSRKLRVPQDVGCIAIIDRDKNPVKLPFNKRHKAFNVPEGAQAVLYFRTKTNKIIQTLIDDYRPRWRQRSRARVQIGGQTHAQARGDEVRFYMDPASAIHYEDHTISNASLDLGAGITLKHKTTRKRTGR